MEGCGRQCKRWGEWLRTFCSSKVVVFVVLIKTRLLSVYRQTLGMYPLSHVFHPKSIPEIPQSHFYVIETPLLIKYVCIIKTTGMKLSIALALQYFASFHYVIFFTLFLLLTPAKHIRPFERLSEIKIAKTEQPSIAIENTEEILHGELLFK